MAQRTSFPEATVRVLNTLKDGEPLTVARLAEKTELNRRTVERVIEMLRKLQPTLEEMKFEVTPIGRLTTIRLRQRGGLLSLPDDVQRLIIRTAYFPTPSRETEIMAHLYLSGALSPRKAVDMEKTAIVQRLLELGRLKEGRGGKIYLTEEGKMVAIGALDVYPELSDVAKRK